MTNRPELPEFGPRARAARKSETRPPVEPAIDEAQAMKPDLKSQVANEISQLLRTPIVTGGMGDEEQEDARESYNDQSYANAPVHDQWFNTSERSQGPLRLDMEKLEIDGVEYKLGWITCKKGAEAHTAAVSAALMAGWRPVPLDHLPKTLRSFAFKSDLGDNLYIINDVVLMMMPRTLHEKWEQRQAAVANSMMSRVEQYAEFQASLAGMPTDAINTSQRATRQVFTGRHATAAVQDALEQSGRAPATGGHTLRGFRQH